MASERMRILICKFELSNAIFFFRDAWLPWSAQKPSAARATLRRIRRIFITPPRFDWSGLAALECPETAARAILGRTRRIFIPPPVSDWSGLGCPGKPRSADPDAFSSPPLGPPSLAILRKGLSECLAFLTYTQNYFELDCVFSSHP